MTPRELFEPLDSELDALLDAERDAPSPPPGARARVSSKLADSLGLALGATASALVIQQTATATTAAVAPAATGAGIGGAGAAGTAAAGATTAAATGTAVAGTTAGVLSSLGAAKIPIVFAVGSAVGVGVTTVATRPERPPVVHQMEAPPTPPESPVLEVAPPPPQIIEAPAEPAPKPVAPKAKAVQPASPPPPVPAPPSRDARLATERALIERARMALGRDRPVDALAALAVHVQDFPAGQLEEEREVLWIQALLASGRRGEAEQRADKFRREHKDSLLLPALDAAFRAVSP